MKIRSFVTVHIGLGTFCILTGVGERQQFVAAADTVVPISEDTGLLEIMSRGNRQYQD